MSIEIFVRRNSDLTRLGQVEDYEDLQLVLKFNLASKWVLRLDGSSLMADQFDTNTGIIVERDGVVLISGPVEIIKQTWDANGYKFEISGSDDSVYLNRRIVFPAAWPFTASAYDSHTAAAESNLHYYVNKNAGPGADADRRVPGLVMGADNGNGSSVTGSGRLQQLNDLVTALALAGGDLRFQIVQVDDELQFQTFVPEDLTDTVQFSPELGNLDSFIYERSGPTANYFYAGGSGTGTGRAFRRGSDSSSVSQWGLAESFVDRRDTSSTSEIDQTITEQLAEQSETLNLAIKPVDTEAIAFGRDYNLGDKVRVITPNGTVIEDAIREVHLSYSSDDSEAIEPVIGTPGATHPRQPAIFKARQHVEQRTRDLERI